MAEETADWVTVLLAMYNTEVPVENEYTISKRRTAGTDEAASSKIHPREIASRNVELLSNVGVSQLRVAEVINYLHEQGLVETSSPPFGTSPTIYRLSGKGFEIAHDLRTSRDRDDWRSRNQRTNLLLALATVVLAVNAASELLGGVSLPIRPASVIAILFVGVGVGLVFGRWSV